MPLRSLTTSAGALKSLGMRVSAFIEPCLPSPADRPPSGPGWIHEIKHDGFRMMVRRDAAGVRLLTRNGHDWSTRYPQIFGAARALRVRSFLVDGEAVACDGDGGRYSIGCATVARTAPCPATSCSGTPARWGWRGSSRSGSARATAPAARRTGSR